MNILFRSFFGSTVYGTNTPESDKDFKGVFISKLDDIILKRDQETMVSNTSSHEVRNTSEDVDIELKELRRFIQDCASGQTYALDMLFIPKKFWIVWTLEWEFIIQNRDKLISKNIEPYIGYCRRQAGKYGLKGSRLGELQRVLQYFSKLPPKDLLGLHIDDIEKSEFVHKMTNVCKRNNEMHTESYLAVLGKKFQVNRQIKDILISLTALETRYGERSKMAMQNEGIDWKAISHALRCCYQLMELAETGRITFPLKSAEFLKEVKAGGLHYPDVQERLTAAMEMAVKMITESTLPEKVDMDFWDKWMLDLYKKGVAIATPFQFNFDQ